MTKSKLSKDEAIKKLYNRSDSYKEGVTIVYMWVRNRLISKDVMQELIISLYKKHVY